MILAVRTTIVLACVFFAGYWFTRPHDPLWTTNTTDSIIQVAPDSKTFWIKSVVHDGSDDTSVVLRQVRLVDGAELNRYSIHFAGRLNNCHAMLSQDGNWINVSISKHEVNESIRGCVINTATGEHRLVPYLNPMPSSISSTGKWLFNPYAGLSNEVYSRSPFAKVYSIRSGAPTGGYWRPDAPKFSPDDCFMAIAWNESKRELEGKPSGKICIYSTRDWSCVRTVDLSDPGYPRLLHWKRNDLYFQREVADHPPRRWDLRHVRETYILNHPQLEIAIPEIVFVNDKTDRNQKPNSPYEHRGYGGEGEGWHAVHHLSYRPRSKWLLDLGARFPAIGSFLDSRWPAGRNTYDFYNTTTGKRTSEIDVGRLRDFRTSPDGRWIVGVEGPPNRLVALATAPSSMALGYFSLALALIAMVCNRSRVARLIPLKFMPPIRRQKVPANGES